MKFKISVFLKILILFSLTQLLGLYLAVNILPTIGLQNNFEGLGGFSFADYTYVAIVIFLFFFFSIKYPRIGTAIYRGFLTLIIFSAFQVFFSIWLTPIISLAWAVIITVLFWLMQKIVVQDAIMLITFASVGAVLGLSLTPTIIVYILIIFSIYDIIAVYVTGHMIKMAEAMIHSRAIFGFVVPNSINDFKAHIGEVKPGEQFMILGSGDVIFPLLLSVSLISISIWQSLVIFIFSLSGLFLMHLFFVNQKTRRPMAALPPIAAMTILGYLLILLF